MMWLDAMATNVCHTGGGDVHYCRGGVRGVVGITNCYLGTPTTVAAQRQRWRYLHSPRASGLVAGESGLFKIVDCTGCGNGVGGGGGVNNVVRICGCAGGCDDVIGRTGSRRDDDGRSCVVNARFLTADCGVRDEEDGGRGCKRCGWH